MPAFGYDQADDPLGIGLQERARQHRERFNQLGQQNAANHGQLVSFGRPSLPMSPSMEGLFQSMQEQGMTKLGADSGSQFGALPSTAQAGQVGMESYAPRSTHIGMAAHGGGDTGLGVPSTFDPRFQSSAAVRGLQKPAPSYQRGR